MDTHDLENAKLLISDTFGIYIPQLFARHFGDAIKNESDRAILEAGPDHPEYWEAWDDVRNATCVLDQNGLRYHLYQEGDLWAIPA